MILIERILGTIILATGSIYDVKRKSIPKIYAWIAIGISFIFVIFIRRTHVVECMAGLAEGAVAVILARLCGVFGEGDGMVLGSIGLLVGAFSGLVVLFWSVLFAAVFAMIILVSRKGKGKSTIPFLPFMMAGFFTYEVMGGGVW
ncbi:MAG: hypothetical protein MJ105_08255 [Lachnospiraceae bacterium]|nr:hypothetical protein [Lachnospiraceae bacterium]